MDNENTDHTDHPSPRDALTGVVFAVRLGSAYVGGLTFSAACRECRIARRIGGPVAVVTVADAHGLTGSAIRALHRQVKGQDLRLELACVAALDGSAVGRYVVAEHYLARFRERFDPTI